MGVVAEMADRVIVLKAGRLVEQGAVLAIFDQPRPGLYAPSAGSCVLRLGVEPAPMASRGSRRPEAADGSRSLRSGLGRQ